MLNHNGIAVWLWQFRMGLNNDELLPFETSLFGIMARNPVSWILSSVNATTILLTSPSNILQPIGTDKQSNNKSIARIVFH